MSGEAVTREGADRFLIELGELARKVNRGHRRGDPVLVDPFLIARTIAEVMRACTFRTATGQRLLWNDYRMILARADYDVVHSLQGPLERDLGQALANEAAATGAELVGELKVSVVYDEADELRTGQAAVRVAFVPTERLVATRAGELTVRFDAAQLAGLMRAVGSTETVIVQDTASTTSFLVRWPGGQARVADGATLVLGRLHDGAPAGFIALTGSAKINKQHVWITAGAAAIRIGRFVGANPVHVNGASVGAGLHVDTTPPTEVSLSRGELALTIVRG
jgi:hypothetical protein